MFDNILDKCEYLFVPEVRVIYHVYLQLLLLPVFILCRFEPSQHACMLHNHSQRLEKKTVWTRAGLRINQVPSTPAAIQMWTRLSQARIHGQLRRTLELNSEEVKLQADDCLLCLCSLFEVKADCSSKSPRVKWNLQTNEAPQVLWRSFPDPLCYIRIQQVCFFLPHRTVYVL